MRFLTEDEVTTNLVETREATINVHGARMNTVPMGSEATVGGPLSHISELTGAKIRTFLFEVAEGVSNYRSLHGLTQQVEHQYDGRFLIELVQNAHDAFGRSPTPDQPNRIEIVLDPEDSEHGSLLAAKTASRSRVPTSSASLNLVRATRASSAINPVPFIYPTISTRFPPWSAMHKPARYWNGCEDR